MLPLQALPGGPELVIVAVALMLSLLLLVGVLGGLGYFYLHIKSGGSVDERLDRIERKTGRLEAQVEALQEESE
jgi:uncharacterized membrane protein